MLHGDVAGVEIAALKGLCCGIGIFQIAFHHRIASDHDLTLGGAIVCCFNDIRIGNGDPFHHGEGHALAGLDRGLFAGFKIIPILGAPDAFGDVAVGFRQAVDLGDVKAELFDLVQRGGGRRGTGGEDLDGMFKGAALFFGGVDDHVEYDGGTAKVGYAFLCDGVIDCACRDVAAAHQRAADQRHHPGVVPAVAVKERHDLHEHRVQHHPPGDHGAHGHQIGPAVMIDHAFGTACGAGGVVQRQAFPFILGHVPGEIRIARLQQRLVGLVFAGRRQGIGDLNQGGGRALHLRAGGLSQRHELGIDQHDLGTTVIKDIGNGAHVEAGVDGVEHRTAGRHAKMRFGLGRQVGDQRGHNFTRRHAQF